MSTRLSLDNFFFEFHFSFASHSQNNNFFLRLGLGVWLVKGSVNTAVMLSRNVITNRDALVYQILNLKVSSFSPSCIIYYQETTSKPVQSAR